MGMNRYILLLFMAVLAMPVAIANSAHDDDDKKTVVQREIRRLHPERERAKAQKKLLEQMSRKAEPKADPWDTSDEVWGTVDVPRVVNKDSTAVVGRRLTSLATADTDARAVWRDEPVVVPFDQLMLGMTVEGGEYRSKYVSGDSVSNEVYFAFTIPEGDSMPEPLRLCVHYCGDIQVDYDQLVFTIDGYDYLFYPSTARYGVEADGRYWAVSDDELQSPYRDLIYALAHGKWIMVKFKGPHGLSRVKVLNEGQLEDFANTLSLYLLMGGEV